MSERSGYSIGAHQLPTRKTKVFFGLFSLFFVYMPVAVALSWISWEDIMNCLPDPIERFALSSYFVNLPGILQRDYPYQNQLIPFYSLTALAYKFFMFPAALVAGIHFGRKHSPINRESHYSGKNSFVAAAWVLVSFILFSVFHSYDGWSLWAGGLMNKGFLEKCVSRMILFWAISCFAYHGAFYFSGLFSQHGRK